MRLLLDEHHDPEVALQLRARGHDVTAVAPPKAGQSLTDAQVLDLATSQKRAVVTENARDFVVQYRQRLAVGVTHFGIVLTSPKRYPRDRESMGELMTALDRFLGEHDAEDALRDQLVWLP